MHDSRLILRWAGVVLVPLALFLMAVPAMSPWAVPGSLAGLVQLSPAGAIITLGSFLAWTLVRLYATGRPPQVLEQAAFIIAPILVGILLLLNARDLLVGWLQHVPLLSALPPELDLILARAIVLLVVAELVVQWCGYFLDRRLTTSGTVRAWLVALCLATAAGPSIVALPAWLAAQSTAAGLVATFVAIAVAQAALWGLVYVVTGAAMDALHLRRPTAFFLERYGLEGLKKGAIYGVVFLGILHLVAAILAFGPIRLLYDLLPGPMLLVAGALAFPLVRSVVESSDASSPFFRRLAAAYRQPVNYARGLVMGAGVWFAVHYDLPARAPGLRFLAGALLGAAAWALVDLVVDLATRRRHRRTTLTAPRALVVGALLGAVVGGALAWYLDQAQLAVILDKFHRYVALSTPAQPYVIWPLFSKWGQLDLGPVTSGAALLWLESVSGVIAWSLAAPLFGLNLVLLRAIFTRSLAPIWGLASREGMAELVGSTVRVLRWGLWMAPVIYSFLKMSAVPTWYNQDGAIRSLLAIWFSVSTPGDVFRSWSLQTFLGLLAYDWLRVMIWFDHMGLRVATLVNLSFIGMDRVDEGAARWIGHRGRWRFIPEGVRRFFTWAPLLIPFYIPRGADWDQVWTAQDQVRAADGILPAVTTLLWAYGTFTGLFVIAAAIVLWQRRRTLVVGREPTSPVIASNGLLTRTVDTYGRGHVSVVRTAAGGLNLDLERRRDDPLPPVQPFLWLDDGSVVHAFPTLGTELDQPDPRRITLVDRLGDLDVKVTFDLPGDARTEAITVEIGSAARTGRRLRVAYMRPLSLDLPDAWYRGAPYLGLFIETCFARAMGGLLAVNRIHRSPELYFLALRPAPGVRLLGYEDDRRRFLGVGDQARPQTMVSRSERPLDDEGSLATFDPCAALIAEVDQRAGATASLTFVQGFADGAAAMLGQVFAGRDVADFGPAELARLRARRRRILPPVQAGATWMFDGDQLAVAGRPHRPWSMVLAGRHGLGAIVDTHGAGYVFAKNAQQNALTPPDLGSIVPLRPGRRIRVTDLLDGRHASLADPTENDIVSIFRPGSFVQRVGGGRLTLEVTTVVHPDLPVELRQLRVTSHAERPIEVELCCADELTLAEHPVDSLGVIEVELVGQTVLARNPQNRFVQGWMFLQADLDELEPETRRGLVDDQAEDQRRMVQFTEHAAIPPGQTITRWLVTGFAAERQAALDLAEHFRAPHALGQGLAAARHYWSGLLGRLRIETADQRFDRLVDSWLPYQALAARFWGRVGPDQRGGAYGFRDQIQDVLAVMPTRPDLVRAQILLHASRQFPEGDAVKWWHEGQDGRPILGQRTMASDPHLWLAYALGRYVEATGDLSILAEEVPFIDGPAVPDGQEGLLIAPLVSAEHASLFEHAVRAIDWTFRHFGRSGLPLMLYGDWNDGMDQIGPKGRGESIWVGCFLRDILLRLAPAAERHGRPEIAARWRTRADALRDALRAVRVDGRFPRAILDDGRPLMIWDALSASWPVIADVVDLAEGVRIVEDALQVLEHSDRVLLLSPAFDERSQPYPGRIAEYPVGVRENGGQYSHGATWLVDALARLARMAQAQGDRALAERLQVHAYAVWRKISPIERDGRDGLLPIQQPADIYSGPGYEGRGGWSWYTGAAGRMVDAAHGLLGLRLRDGMAELVAVPDGGPALERIQLDGQLVSAEHPVALSRGPASR